MDKSEKEKLIKIMLKNRKEELEELEKGIVLCTLKIESLAQNHFDVHTISTFKKRREELEEEYERLKEEISILESGELPEAKKKNALQKAKENFQKCMEEKQKIESKRNV